MRRARPEDDPVRDPLFARALAERDRTGKFQGELTYLRSDGTRFPVEISTAIIGEFQGEPCVCIIFRDITEQKRAEAMSRRPLRALRTLSECNEALVGATDERVLLDAICRVIVEVGGYRVSWVGFAGHDERKTV